MKERADELLAARGLAPSRERAQALIMAGRVVSGGRTIEKPGALVDADAELVLKETLPFVGRGGLKLAEALDASPWTSAAEFAADVGASTGGFTDCLLQRGAARVYAVDVDIPTRRRSAATRASSPGEERPLRRPRRFRRAPSLAVMDVSFISILKILPALRAIRAGRGARRSGKIRPNRGFPHPAVPHQTAIRGGPRRRGQEGDRPRPGRSRGRPDADRGRRGRGSDSPCAACSAAPSGGRRETRNSSPAGRRAARNRPQRTKMDPRGRPP